MKESLAMYTGDISNKLMGKHTLVLNTNNSLIQSLYDLHLKKPGITKSIIKQLYETSLFSQKELNKENFTSYVNRFNEIVENLVKCI